MPTVPIYKRTEALRPILQQGVNVRSNADSFGASAARGLEAAASGANEVSKAIVQVQDLKNRSVAKQTGNDYAARSIDNLTNYFSLSGQNAIDQRADFQKTQRELRLEVASKLTPAQQRLFNDYADTYDLSNNESMARHAGGELKKQVIADSDASSANFMNQALIDSANADKLLGAGLEEIKEKGRNLGWSPDQLDLAQRNYLSEGTQKMALRIAAKSPVAAKAYIEKHWDRLNAEDQFELDTRLAPIIKEGEGNSKASEFWRLRRGGGDIVNEVMEAGGREEPGRSTGAERPISATGPSRARQFLISKAPGKSPEAIDGLDEGFATNLAAMLEDAPPGIREGLKIGSAFRSNERQEQLFAKSDGSGRMVAFPAGYKKPDGSIAKGSNHLHGRAVDLTWNGQLLKPGNAPQEVLDWVHSNVGRYGMYFRMSWEPWHVEPTGSASGAQVVAKTDGATTRAKMPSYDEIQTFLGGIADPVVRDKTETKIFQMLGQQSTLEEQNSKDARQRLWEMWEKDGKTPDEAPLDLRLAAGNTAIDGLNNTIRREKEGETVTDQSVLFGLNRMAAENPQQFKNVDLSDYFPQLAREDRKALTTSQNALISGDAEAQKNGTVYASAYKQADQAMAAAGITTTGISQNDGEARVTMEKRIAQFQNQLKLRIDDFRTQNGKTPTYDEQQALINELLLPIVIQQPGTLWGTNETKGSFLFEAPTRKDGTAFEVRVPYTDIPFDFRTHIADVLQQELGRKPKPEEVELEYSKMITGAR